MTDGRNKRGFLECYNTSRRILTEGSVGLRTVDEFGLARDENVMHAGLIYSAEGRRALTEIYGGYLSVARAYGLPILLMTNTRRANKERVNASVYRDRNIIGDYAEFLREIIAVSGAEAYVGGYIGGKGDGYTAEGALTVAEAENFHAWQIEAFCRAGVDLVFPSLMTTAAETVGMAAAIEKSGLPYVVSFMITEDGILPGGTRIDDTIRTIDTLTSYKPLCYMANCVHPKTVRLALRLNDAALIRERFKGIQANGAYLPPDELEALDGTLTSDPRELAEEIIALDREFPMKIIGGCCGTSDTHLREFANLLNE